MRKPWFHIIDVVELRGRSLADIAAEVCRLRRVPLKQVRTNNKRHVLTKARFAIIDAVKQERPDIRSQIVGDYLRIESSCVRRRWRLAA